MGFSLSGGPNVGVASGMLNASNNLAGQFGSSQQTEGAQLNPFFSQEMKAQHSLSPSATGEMLTAAEAGAGGAFGGAEGEMKANAARTGNATGITKSLDDMARDKAKSAAGASEGIAAQDVQGAANLRQQGAAGMQGLYGTNVSGQLGAMKQTSTDLQNLSAAQQQAPGWLQGIKNVSSGVNSIESMDPMLPNSNRNSNTNNNTGM